jgi:dihydrofolate reductase
VGKLIYLMNVSLDGFVETPDHGLDWASIDDELHTWFNDQMRGLDAELYGRRLYEVMAAHWPTAESDPAAGPVEIDFARIWNAMPKIVFSNSLESVDFNSRLVTGDVGEELAKLKAEFDGDLGVGGPTLAAEFIKRGLVDEYRQVVHPVVLGAGTPFFPPLDEPIGLRLSETRAFASGAVYRGYAATRE